MTHRDAEDGARAAPGLQVGDRVELVRRVPLSGESIVPLGPGDLGVVQVLGKSECIILVSGLSVRVPRTAVIPAGSVH